LHWFVAAIKWWLKMLEKAKSFKAVDIARERTRVRFAALAELPP
jgi:hypothetical protein